MKEKDYTKPTMQVYEMKQKVQLLQGSEFKGSRRNYGSANQGVDNSEIDEETGEWEW